MKTRPELEAFLFCRRVRVEANGSKSLIGIFETAHVGAQANRPLLAGSVPPVGFEFGIYTRWCSGLGHFVQRVDMKGPDGEVLTVGEALLEFGDPFVPQNSYGSVGEVFSEPGPHVFRLYLDGELVVEKTLEVDLRVPRTRASNGHRRL